MGSLVWQHYVVADQVIHCDSAMFATTEISHLEGALTSTYNATHQCFPITLQTIQLFPIFDKFRTKVLHPTKCFFLLLRNNLLLRQAVVIVDCS